LIIRTNKIDDLFEEYKDCASFYLVILAEQYHCGIAFFYKCVDIRGKRPVIV
jgi:hypothetical protein